MRAGVAGDHCGHRLALPSALVRLPLSSFVFVNSRSFDMLLCLNVARSLGATEDLEDGTEAVELGLGVGKVDVGVVALEVPHELPEHETTDKLDDPPDRGDDAEDSGQDLAVDEARDCVVEAGRTRVCPSAID